jgi:long-subunit fatty acid transport protein
MPVIGVQWKFAPDWQFDVGFPRTGVSYKVDSNLTMRGGLSVLGGGYRITENLGVPAPGIARLNNTYLDLTEIRLGAGLAYKFEGGLELDFDAGVTTLRRFEYPDRNFRLNSDNVGWLSVSLNHRF